MRLSWMMFQSHCAPIGCMQMRPHCWRWPVVERRGRGGVTLTGVAETRGMAGRHESQSREQSSEHERDLQSMVRMASGVPSSYDSSHHGSMRTHRALTTFPWMPVFVTVGLTLSSIASLLTVIVLYVRPMFQAAEKAAQSADEASKDMQKAAIEMEKTALMFQEEMPLTLKDLQKASEEWELVGKQLNVAVTSVTRPLKPVEKPVERAIGAAERNTRKFSKRIVTETTAVANALWSSVNQLGQQLGWRGMTTEAMEEAQRSAYIGLKQQEARSWIDKWRRKNAQRVVGERNQNQRNGALSSNVAIGRDHDEVSSPRKSPFNDLGYMPSDNIPENNILNDIEADSRYSVEYRRDTGEGVDPVKDVFNALARAQLAAEEAAASSTALEMAIERAEQSGMLSSSDEEDEIPTQEVD